MTKLSYSGGKPSDRVIFDQRTNHSECRWKRLGWGEDKIDPTWRKWYPEVEKATLGTER